MKNALTLLSLRHLHTQERLFNIGRTEALRSAGGLAARVTARLTGTLFVAIFSSTLPLSSWALPEGIDIRLSASLNTQNRLAASHALATSGNVVGIPPFSELIYHRLLGDVSSGYPFAIERASREGNGFGMPETLITDCTTPSYLNMLKGIDISPDGRWLLLHSNAQSGGNSRDYLYVVDLSAETFSCDSSLHLIMSEWTYGGTSFAFSPDSKHILVGLPGYPFIPPDLNTTILPMPFGPTQGKYQIFSLTEEEQWVGLQQLNFFWAQTPLPNRAFLPAFNGEAGSSVAISANQVTIAATHPARRPTCDEVDCTDPNNPPVYYAVPEIYDVNFPTGIFLGRRQDSTSLHSLTFVELPQAEGAALQTGSIAFGHNNLLRISRDSNTVVLVQQTSINRTEFAPRQAYLHSFAYADSGWTQINSLTVMGDPRSTSATNVFPGCVTDQGPQDGLPSVFSWEYYRPSDIALSADGKRLAVAIANSFAAWLSPSFQGMICLYERQNDDEWKPVEGAGNVTSALLSFPDLGDDRISRRAIQRMRGNADLSALLVPVFDGANILSIDWGDTTTGLPIWLLYEASRLGENRRVATDQ